MANSERETKLKAKAFDLLSVKIQGTMRNATGEALHSLIRELEEDVWAQADAGSDFLKTR